MLTVIWQRRTQVIILIFYMVLMLMPVCSCHTSGLIHITRLRIGNTRPHLLLIIPLGFLAVYVYRFFLQKNLRLNPGSLTAGRVMVCLINSRAWEETLHGARMKI